VVEVVLRSEGAVDAIRARQTPPPNPRFRIEPKRALLREGGLTLVRFLRDRRFVVYSHTNRVAAG
jgi:hypothetical protein